MHLIGNSLVIRTGAATLRLRSGQAQGTAVRLRAKGEVFGVFGSRGSSRACRTPGLCPISAKLFLLSVVL